MKRYWKFLVPAGLAVVALGFLIANLNSNLVYFNTPTELMQRQADDARLRLGGQVVPGTVAESATGAVFEVTDGRETVLVDHTGAPPDLFQEGIGVVVEGSWDGSEFHSDTMLVKHDENYSPENPDEPFPGS